MAELARIGLLTVCGAAVGLALGALIALAISASVDARQTRIGAADAQIVGAAVNGHPSY